MWLSSMPVHHSRSIVVKQRNYAGAASAIASNLRLELPLFLHVLFSTYVAVLLWGGLYLTEVRVRTLFAASFKEECHDDSWRISTRSTRRPESVPRTFGDLRQRSGC